MIFVTHRQTDTHHNIYIATISIIIITNIEIISFANSAYSFASRVFLPITINISSEASFSEIQILLSFFRYIVISSYEVLLTLYFWTKESLLHHVEIFRQTGLIKNCHVVDCSMQYRGCRVLTLWHQHHQRQLSWTRAPLTRTWFAVCGNTLVMVATMRRAEMRTARLVHSWSPNSI